MKFINKQLILNYKQIIYLRMFQAQASLPAHTVTCPECGQILALPKLRQGEKAICTNCDHIIVEISNNPFISPLAYATTALILMVFVYSSTFLQIQLLGIETVTSLYSMMTTLINQDFGFLAKVLFFLTFITPLIFVSLCLYVYSGLNSNKIFPKMLLAVRLMTHLKHWIMVDVFFISTLVAYIKLVAQTDVTFGPAFWLMFALSITLIRTSMSISTHWVYDKINKIKGIQTKLIPDHDNIICHNCLFYNDKKDSTCKVCTSKLNMDHKKRLTASLALLLSAMIFYLPANILPIMITASPIGSSESTIISGIIYMWNTGDIPIAIIIFSASMLVPILKIISMCFLIYCAYFKPILPAKSLSRIYRITDSVGRWSMIDIFVIIILMSSFNTSLAKVTAGPAALYFSLVVFLTMFSAQFFDPILFWDKERINKKKMDND